MAEIKRQRQFAPLIEWRRAPPVCSLSCVAFTPGARPHSEVTPLGPLYCWDGARKYLCDLRPPVDFSRHCAWAPGPHSPQPLQKSPPARLNPVVAHESPFPPPRLAAAAARFQRIRDTVTHRSGSTWEHICIGRRQLEYAGHTSAGLRRGSRGLSSSSGNSRSRYPSATRAVGGQSIRLRNGPLEQRRAAGVATQHLRMSRRLDF